MGLLDTTVVTVALPVIARDFHTGLSDLQWVISAYTIALAVLIVISACHGDIFGRKKVFIVGLAVFSFGSLLCALSGRLTIAGWLTGRIGGRLILFVSMAMMSFGVLLMMVISPSDQQSD